MERETVRVRYIPKVLVIGGCGYIGSKLCEYLSSDYRVTSVDIGWFGGFDNNLFIDYKNLTNIFVSQYDVVILLAGHSSVQMCVGNPISCYNNNVLNFVKLIASINESNNYKSIKFIYASSSSVYGDIKEQIAKEGHMDFHPNNEYDLSKQIIDLYASLYKNLEYYSLRFGTVNGFSRNFRTDIMINAMYNSFDKYGYIKEYNSEVHRPILDIKDLCRAIRKIINNGVLEKSGIYNLCSFNSIVKDIVYEAREVLCCAVVKSKDKIENTKLQTKLYDFSIDNTKFCDSFNFKFEGTVESILLDIIDNKKQINKTHRNIKVSYV